MFQKPQVFFLDLVITPKNAFYVEIFTIRFLLILSFFSINLRKKLVILIKINSGFSAKLVFPPLDAESAWLRTAPPWRPASPAPVRTGKPKPAELATAPALRQQKAELLEEERTLGKLAHVYARDIRRVGWRRFVASCRGGSNLPASVKGIPHRAARLLSHLVCMLVTSEELGCEDLWLPVGGPRTSQRR